MTKDELEIAIKSASVWSGRSTLLLAVGILGEYVLLPFLERKHWLRSAKIVLGVLVVAGIVGEYEFSSRIAQYADELQRISDRELQAATDKASDADLKRAELEKKIVQIFGPRSLNVEQSNRISAKLSRFSGVMVDVYAFAVGNPWNRSESEDSKRLARDILGSLVAARMNAAGWILGSCFGGGASNVVVALARPNAREQDVASRIIASLSPEIDTFPEIAPGDPPVGCRSVTNLTSPQRGPRTQANISVLVGRKIPSMPTLEEFGIPLTK
jgi:hypothetical protein